MSKGRRSWQWVASCHGEKVMKGEGLKMASRVTFSKHFTLCFFWEMQPYCSKYPLWKVFRYLQKPTCKKPLAEGSSVHKPLFGVGNAHQHIPGQISSMYHQLAMFFWKLHSLSLKLKTSAPRNSKIYEVPNRIQAFLGQDSLTNSYIKWDYVTTCCQYFTSLSPRF